MFKSISVDYSNQLLGIILPEQVMNERDVLAFYFICNHRKLNNQWTIKEIITLHEPFSVGTDSGMETHMEHLSVPMSA